MINPTAELTYTIRGADGKQYGPVSLEQVSMWVREGRITPDIEIQRSDMQHWARADQYTEFQTLLPQVQHTSIPAPTVTRTANPAALGTVKSGGSWFYWIAGLSLINTISAFAGSDWRFIVGLGITQLFDYFAAEAGTAAKAVVLVLDLLVAAVFVLFGVFACKARLWAFIVGMALFALDGVIFLIGKDWLGVGFHAFVLFCLFRGAKACRDAS